MSEEMYIYKLCACDVTCSSFSRIIIMDISIMTYQKSNHLVNYGSREAALVTSKLHSYTKYKTLDMQ